MWCTFIQGWRTKQELIRNSKPQLSDIPSQNQNMLAATAATATLLQT
jgi:hypothetical protein